MSRVVTKPRKLPKLKLSAGSKLPATIARPCMRRTPRALHYTSFVRHLTTTMLFFAFWWRLIPRPRYQAQGENCIECCDPPFQPVGDAAYRREAMKVSRIWMPKSREIRRTTVRDVSGSPRRPNIPILSARRRLLRHEFGMATLHALPTRAG